MTNFYSALTRKSFIHHGIWLSTGLVSEYDLDDTNLTGISLAREILGHLQPRPFCGVHFRAELDYRNRVGENYTHQVASIISRQVPTGTIIYIASGLSHSPGDSKLVARFQDFSRHLKGYQVISKENFFPTQLSVLPGDQVAIIDYLVMREATQNIYTKESSFSMWLHRLRSNPRDAFIEKQ